MDSILVARGTDRVTSFWSRLYRYRFSLVDWRTVVAFGLPFTLYLFTLAPTVYNLDSAEFTTAAATGGIVRATGYPLYLLLGRAWSLLPVGDVGFRMNLFSAFNGALTIALAERILRRLSVGPWAAFGALGLLASAPFFWALSLIAEVYTLHTALMAGIILLLLRWAEDPTPRRLAVVALALGFGAGNHAAVALLVPGCVWYALTIAPRRALKLPSLLLASAGLLIGLSVYLYLPLRYGMMPTFNYAGHFDAAGAFVPINLKEAQGLWWLISGRAFAGEMLGYGGAELWREVAHFSTQLWRAFFAVGVGPGLLGIVVTLRRDWRLGGLLLLMFGFSAGFYIDYRVVDKDTMFLPAYLIWALWVGIGYQALLRWARQGGGISTPRWSEMLLRVGMVAAVLVAVAWNWRLVDLSDDWSARDHGERILDLVKPNALVLGWWDTAPLIEYLQLVEGRRPDIQVINRFLISQADAQRLIQQEMARRPVYIDRPPPDLLRIARAEPVGPVYRLWSRE